LGLHLPATSCFENFVTSSCTLAAQPSTNNIQTFIEIWGGFY
jgi:hypothetical protein